MTLDWSKYRALSFDCYGTLIDWETGIANALDPWAQRSGVAATDEGTRESLLERFARWESAVEREDPTALYPQILSGVLERLSGELGAPATSEECTAFGASVPDWPSFPDSPAALARLKERFQLYILSNVDRTSFAGSNRRLQVEFNGIFTAQDIGSYKPDPRNFDYLLARLDERGISKGELLHVAQSLHHDIEPAKELGLDCVWVDRRHGRDGGGATAPPKAATHPDLVVHSLEELAALTP